MMTLLVENQSTETLAEPKVAPAPAPVPEAVEAPKRWIWDVGIILQMFAVLVIGLLLNLVFVSQLQYSTSQSALRQDLRLQLAQGSAPIGQNTIDGTLTPLGTPIALLEIPQLKKSEVIVEGTTSAQTAVGVGHRRDSSFPGQAGTAILMGRSGAYGGVFSAIGTLKPGARFAVTTGQGTFTYQVIGSRRAGDPMPPTPKPTEGRLTLTTAAGVPFMPQDVLRVDARLVSEVAPTPPRVFAAGEKKLPESEQTMGQDFSGMLGIIILFQLLTAAVIAAIWCWKRWGKWHTWIALAPILLTISILLGNQINMILPNLL